MPQKLPVHSFEWDENISKFKESFIKNCNEYNDIGYISKADVGYPKHLHDSRNDLPFLPERMKIKKVT